MEVKKTSVNPDHRSQKHTQLSLITITKEIINSHSKCTWK